MNPNEFTEEELREAHAKHGECGSCSWHAAFWEHEFVHQENTTCPNEYWDICRNSDLEEGEAESHRGCFIYPEKKIKPSNN